MPDPVCIVGGVGPTCSLKGTVSPVSTVPVPGPVAAVFHSSVILTTPGPPWARKREERETHPVVDPHVPGLAFAQYQKRRSVP